MDPSEAQQKLLEQVEAEVREEATKLAKQIEEEARENADRAAKRLLLDVMQRGIVDTITEATTAVVELPSEDLKAEKDATSDLSSRSRERTC
jgi:ribonuclease Y